MLFSLPGIEEFKTLNQFFLQLYKESKELFYSQVEFNSVYGSFPGLVWNGGRYSREGNITLKEADYLFKFYEKYDVKLRFTFTNMLISRSELDDAYCNQILSLIKAHNGEVVIHSKVLEDYIRGLYPTISIISSTTKCITDLEALNQELTQDYKLVTLDFRKNSDSDFLKGINAKERVELLVNESCFAICRNRKRHYRDISKNILAPGTAPTSEGYCPGKYTNLYESFSQDETIKAQDLFKKYSEMGFNNAKICGRRGDYFNVLESYLHYLIKPEYINELRLQILQTRIHESEALHLYG